MWKKSCAWMVAIALLAGLTSCATKARPQGDVLTQTILSKDKIAVSVLVKNAFTINTFEAEAEKKFPQLDLIQVGNYTSDMGIAEYAARLEHDDLTDMVMTWPLEVGEEYWESRLLDLSALPLSGKYNTAMLNAIAKNGKLFYLPGPSQVRGIVYNKTLFQEKGWTVPKDFDGFISLCQTIEESGIRALQLGLGNEEVLDTAFVGYGYAGSFSKPGDAQWLSEYNQGKGSFGEQFAPALDTFQTLIDTGILQKKDLQITYSDREQMLFTRQCAMVEDSVLMARMGDSRTGSTDEFALMPFFNPGEDGDWARLYPVCYVGVSKKLAEPLNQAKYNLVMQLLEYISTPEGQEALAGDTGAMYSSLNGVLPPDIPEIDDLMPALSHGRCAVFPTLKNAQGALRRGLAGMVEGTATAEDVAKMVDRENLSPPVTMPPKVLGTATKDFTLLQTGSLVTDLMRAQSGCEIALFLDNGKDGKCNGKGVSARLYQGDVTTVDVKRIFPDLRYGEKGELWKVTVTGEDLVKVLEYSISVDNHISGWFYYFSGLRMEYDPTAQPGQRIHKLTDDSGKAIQPKRVYSVAVMDESIPEEYMLSCEKTQDLVLELLEKSIQNAKTVSPSEDGRFVICNDQCTQKQEPV